MRRTEVVNVSFETLVADMKSSEITLAVLPDSAVRTLLVSATLTRSALQRADGEKLDPYLLQVIMQVNWLAEQILIDAGLLTEEARLPAFRAVNRHVIQIEQDARLRLSRPTIGRDGVQES